MHYRVFSREMLFKAAGLDKIPRNEYTQRRRQGIEHKGMPSFRGWKAGDLANERGREPRKGLTQRPSEEKFQEEKALSTESNKSRGGMK